MVELEENDFMLFLIYKNEFIYIRQLRLRPLHQIGKLFVKG